MNLAGHLIVRLLRSDSRDGATDQHRVLVSAYSRENLAASYQDKGLE